jgi:hypothetical protein
LRALVGGAFGLVVDGKLASSIASISAGGMSFVSPTAFFGLLAASRRRARP